MFGPGQFVKTEITFTNLELTGLSENNYKTAIVTKLNTNIKRFHKNIKNSCRVLTTNVSFISFVR